MTLENIKIRTQTFWQLIRKHGILTLIVGVVLLLLIVGLQRSCDRRTEERENEKIRKYDEGVAERLRVFQTYIEAANREHATTTAILDTLAGMTKNINLLAENDKIIDARVSEISQNEYGAARNQRNNQTAVANHTAKPPKTNRPLKERETAALAADRELYPNN